MYLQLRDNEGEVALEMLTADGLQVAIGLANAFLKDAENALRIENANTTQEEAQ